MRLIIGAIQAETCLVIQRLPQHGIADFEITNRLQRVAKQLLNTCVLRKDLPEGGVVGNAGTHDNLIMTLRDFLPRATYYLRSSKVAPPSCLGLLQDMPAIKKTALFTKPNYERHVTIPKDMQIVSFTFFR